MRYRETGKKDNSSSLYSLLPETLETVHAKEVSELVSQVRLLTLEPYVHSSEHVRG